MMKRFLLVVWLALSIMAAGMPAATQAAEIEIKRFSGGVAHAFFSSLDPADPTGCTVLEGNLDVISGMATVGSGKRERLALISVAPLIKYDRCNWEEYVHLNGFVHVDPTTIQFDSTLNTAAANVAIELKDRLSGSSYPVTLNLTWTGVGDTMVKRQLDQTKTENYMITSNARYSFRSAAAAGPVSRRGATGRRSPPSPLGLPGMTVQT
jgi:hypothetical protein